MTDIKQTDFRVGNEITPLVVIGARTGGGELRFTVECQACGGVVQTTGDGGYTVIEDAKAALEEHRLTHLRELTREAFGISHNSLFDALLYIRVIDRLLDKLSLGRLGDRHYVNASAIAQGKTIRSHGDEDEELRNSGLAHVITAAS
jgi:hypothetical protein